MKKAFLFGFAAIITSGLVPIAGSAQENGAPTWTDDIGPLMSQSCMNCHRPGQIAPMSLLTYEEVLPWVRSIRLMVRNRIMPPWHADPRYGDFGNDRRLSDEQVDMMVQWVGAGAPRGEGTFTQPAFAEATDGFLLTGELGPPDYVFRMSEGFVVPAGGPDVNPAILVPTGLETDIWVQAAEVRGNFQVVHHNVVSILGPDGNYARTGRLASTVPGKQWDRFPDGSGKLIEAGSTLRFGLHYHPSNVEVVDTSSVAVWLVKNEITHELHSSVVADVGLRIPPYDPNYESRGEFVFETDAAITLVKPHMHYRGKDFTFTAKYPDGTQEVLLSVPSYDFAWQTNYIVREPIEVPAGTIIETVAHYDNSANNPNNPDPTKNVRFGDESYDEMMIGFVDFVVDEGMRMKPLSEIRRSKIPELAAMHPGHVYAVTASDPEFLAPLYLPREGDGIFYVIYDGSLVKAKVWDIAWDGDQFTATVESPNGDQSLTGKLTADGGIETFLGETAFNGEIWSGESQAATSSSGL